jgi:hypothetical protein
MEQACARHMDPTIAFYKACYMCLGERPSRTVDDGLGESGGRREGYLFAHEKCLREDLSP